ncbi:uncharacterized protein [Argopecten irradians]|uniref:uncharacterized protein n=1 Tax=Argopecten irradians TaxID=31199 RepID=UPI003718066E
MAGPNNPASKFLETIRNKFLHQHLRQPTRLRENQIPSLLDLIFTNEEEMIEDIAYLDSIGKSDHVGIIFKMICYTNPVNKNINVRKLNFQRGDYEAIKEDLYTIDCDFLNNIDGIENAWTYFTEHLQTIIEKHIPVSRVQHSSRPHNPEIDKEARAAIALKRRKWYKYLNSKTPENFQSYQAARNNATKIIKKSKYKYEEDLSLKINTNPKLFWSRARSKTKTKSTIGGIEAGNGTITTNNEETANVLNTFFASVFVNDGDLPLPVFIPRQVNSLLTDIFISEETVFKAIKRINPNKSPGPDNLHPKFICETADVIKKPLSIIYRKSLDESTLPKDWNRAIVTPIFKKEQKKKLIITGPSA